MTMSKVRRSALVQLRLNSLEQRNLFGGLAADIVREKAVWQFQKRPGQACYAIRSWTGCRRPESRPSRNQMKFPSEWRWT